MQAASRREVSSVIFPHSSELGQKAVVLLTQATIPQLSLHEVQVPDSVLSFVPRWKKKGRKEKTERGREEKRE